jgi:hypothetical protein
MPGFLEDSELSARLDILLKPGDDYERGPWWEPAITDCNAQAWSFIAGTLQAQGYALPDILRWGKAGKSYQSQVALYLLGERARLDVGADRGGAIFFKNVDPRPLLADMELTDDAGVRILPTAGNLVPHGRLKPTGERFRRSDGTFRHW